MYHLPADQDITHIKVLFQMSMMAHHDIIFQLGFTRFRYLANYILQKRAHDVLGHGLSDHDLLGFTRLNENGVRFVKTHVYKRMCQNLYLKSKL